MYHVYQLHFATPLNPNGRHQAQHYIGWAKNLPNRINDHQSGQGARITQAAVQRGIGLTLVRVWAFTTREEASKWEKYLKGLKAGTRLCPICNKNAKHFCQKYKSVLWEEECQQ